MYSKKLMVFILVVLLLALCFGGTVFAEEPPSNEAIRGTPVIDGEMDEIWKSANMIVPLIYKQGNADINAKATIYTMWDENNFYVFADVQDQIVVNLNVEHLFQGDCVEIFIDELYERYDGWDDNDGQWLVSVNNDVETSKRVNGTSKGGIYEGRTLDTAVIKREDGYCIEIAWPWIALKGKVDVGTKIGLQVQIDDDCTAIGAREGVLRWADDNSRAANWGTATMVEVASPKEVTQTDTKSPDESSQTVVPASAEAAPVETTGYSTIIIYAAAALLGIIVLFYVGKKLIKK